MHEKYKKNIIPNDTHTINWEYAADGKDNNNFEGLFIISVGETKDFEECLNIIKAINPGYTLVSSDGTSQFFVGIEISNEYDIYRAFNHAAFNNAGIHRDYYFNIVDDKLICVVNQYDSSSTDEKIIKITQIL